MICDIYFNKAFIMLMLFYALISCYKVNILLIYESSVLQYLFLNIYLFENVLRVKVIWV